MEEELEPLIAQMTIEEKIAMLAGADMWHTTPIERLSLQVQEGIPCLQIPLSAVSRALPALALSPCRCHPYASKL
jgi:hypothetical protein